ncbi:hypothetical protein AA0Y32_07295 [Georgenia phoenicis]|uniref:hypothetical protein n=1 Tax=unclassified Georgenia TaxID=2626815 RepID=UPI0039B0D3D5
MERTPDPLVDEDVTPDMLDRAARARLRTLSKSNADHVASHLVMAGRLVDVDPERAYEHASTAVRSAGRVDVVREALALTAYATGRYAEALREVRTVRRLSGIDAHPAIEADCERGLGRPERALSVIAEAKGRKLPVAEAVELTLVESGARADLGEHEAALLVVERLLPAIKEAEPKRRLQLVRADRLETLGRHEEAAAVREAAGEFPVEDEDLVVVDLLGDEDEDAAPTHSPSAVDTGAETEEEAEPAQAQSETVPDVADEPQIEAEAEPQIEAEPEPQPEPEAEAEPEPQPEPEAEVEPEPEAEVEPEPEAEVEPEPEAEVEPEPEAEVEPEPEAEVEPEPEPESAPESPAAADEEEPAQVQLDLFADTEEERP